MHTLYPFIIAFCRQCIHANYLLGIIVLDASEIAKFVSGIWQIHAFREGNTRTTAIFTIQYLRSLGYKVNNEMFAKHSWYFRNALVRANYRNIQKGIDYSPIDLVRFFRNLLLKDSWVLKNRYLHIRPTDDWKEQPRIGTPQVPHKLSSSTPQVPHKFSQHREDSRQQDLCLQYQRICFPASKNIRGSIQARRRNPPIRYFQERMGARRRFRKLPELGRLAKSLGLGY